MITAKLEALLILIYPAPIGLMPVCNTRLAIIFLIDLFLSLGPPNPIWLAISHDTDHFLRYWQLAINRGGERMDQVRPRLIPDPEHRTAIAAEATFRVAFLLFLGTAILDRIVYLD